MNLKEYIPFEKKIFRPHQEETIKEIIKQIENGTETILLNAPVGSGKSLMAYCVAKYFQEKEEKSYIYTRTTYLQDQYLRDFKDLKTAMGRSNFDCLMSEEGDTCEYGICKQRPKYVCPIGADTKGSVILRPLEEGFSEHCQYWKQKYDAIKNDISILNYPYLIADNLYINHFPKRKIGIFDEGHGLEASLMGALELEITDYQLNKDLNRSLEIFDNILDWSNQLYDIAEAYKDKSELTSDIRQKERWIKRYESISQCADSLVDNPDNWVFNKFEKRNNRINERVLHVVFKPIEIQEYTDILFGKSEHKIIMSGSILKPDLFVSELGLGDYAYIEVPSIVPQEKRPIKREYVGSMSRRNFPQNLPSLIRKIQDIADRHEGEKGVIHTFTYGINYELFKALGRNKRFIFHTQDNRVQKTNEFKEAPDDSGKIFVSPYSYEGVDFPYDQARWQIICKNPYPYLGDAQVKARMEMDRKTHETDWGWINRQIALTLSQMYGRTNRAEDDYSVTYILDKDVDRNFGPASLVTDYFLEALEGYNYTRPFKIVDLSKIKSRGVNRENQLIIIEEIKKGLNTLELLRKEYKKLPGHSYVEVKKAIDYLLSCGAISYIE